MNIVPFVPKAEELTADCRQNLIARADRSHGRAIGLFQVSKVIGEEITAGWIELRSFPTLDVEATPEEVFSFGPGELPTIADWLHRLDAELKGTR